jgi:cyanophycin synthetase
MTSDSHAAIPNPTVALTRRSAAAAIPASAASGRAWLVQRIPLALRFRVALSGSASVDLGSVDDWLHTVLEDDFDSALAAAIVPASQGDAPGAAIAGRILLLARGLLLAARVPAFAPCRLLRVEAATAGSHYALVELPRLDHMPERASLLALEAAVIAMEAIAAGPLAAESHSRLFTQIEKDALGPIRRLVTSGKSTLHVLRAAWQGDVPFTHLGGGLFQLGWGARARRIDRSTTDGDPATAAKLAQNKVWAASLLRNAGLPAPQHQVVTTLEAARRATQQLGWPVVLKPTDRDRGEGVSIDVADEANLQPAFAVAQKASRARQVIVERQVAGVCHRLFIAGGRLLYAVIRWPKSVHGDGCRSVAELIHDANTAEADRPPWRRSEPFPADAEAIAAMAAAGYALDTIPDAGARVSLRAIESTTSGGFDEEVTDRIHPDNLDIALRATALFGLDVAGIDIITPDIGTPWHANGAIINEVNYAPLLGGGEISRRYVPEFLHRLLGGNGRIPIEAFVGGDAAMRAARARQGELVAAGIACYLTSHAATLTPAGGEAPMPFISLYRHSRALLLDRRVETLLLVIQTEELLRSGLPVDRIDRLTQTADGTEAGLPRESQTALMQLLQATLPSRQMPPSKMPPEQPAITCNLLLIAQPHHVQLADFEHLASVIRAIAPDVHACAIWDRPKAWRPQQSVLERPTMTFCPVPIRTFKPGRGTVFQCYRLHKSEEYRAMERAGIPVPRWGLVTPEAMPDLKDFGPYVVMKPDWSGKGADVKIMRRGRVRWRPPTTDYTKRLQGDRGNWLVQEFIYTGLQPVSFRVTTLFGEPLWAWRIDADVARRPLGNRYDFRNGEGGGGMSIVSSGKGSIFSLIDDPEMNALAKRVCRAFPTIPVLGVDMVRDIETGQLYVIEVNAGGFTWHLSSAVGRKIQHDFAFDIDARFQVYTRAAVILADRARRYAR